MEKTVITCEDGHRLIGHFFRPATESPRGAALISPATGFRHQVYFSFATWLSEQGFAVLTFSNRGIGDSRNHIPLAELSADLVDWGTLDLPAALDQLIALAPNLPVTLVGHSAGAQLIGLMPNFARIDRYVLVAASSGHFNNLKPKTRLAAKLMFHGWQPVSVAVKGYWPTKFIGFGEDLPAGVARQWRHWCSSPGYVENSFGKEIQQHHYGDITAPVLSLTATDDHIAVPANVEDFLRLLPNARIEKHFLEPASFGLKEIGHSDLLRSRCKACWPKILGGLECNG
ncbi:alpha/beta fold hydrolase [Marinobacter sp. 1_MG-2023]|uniref:alpha/beta hydrolase family protein n=1 Tax=Marinobacter sp. 1_MG-2023 TaxID=3062627 RepID=UPI0026E1A97D|nr:alpha/beta fold hydrolase [Marinobacter sp. 1_MG-2023]MDO6822136.1 alpha/beta fold hydrolase [Marinobacter sp. 1_MG-2023]